MTNTDLRDENRIDGSQLRAEVRRLVVFDVPDQVSLVDALTATYPSLQFQVESDWRSLNTIPTHHTPVWYWTNSVEDFHQASDQILRHLAHPLVVSQSQYCIGFPFSQDVVSAGELDLTTMTDLNMEDIGRLFLSDAVSTTFSLLPHLNDRIPQTPIEERLAKAMTATGIVARPQIRVGPYRVDFLINSGKRRIAVEADGHGFHDIESDRIRDEALRELGIDAVVRFTGSRIYRDADSCAQEIHRHLREATSPQRRRVRQHEVHLDASQEQAAHHTNGAVRVLAPAGSGKTTTMVERVADLVDGGIRESSILVLAFNRKAAEQLEQRLPSIGIRTRRKLFDPEHDGVVCATFNAFGSRYQHEVVGTRLNLQTGTAVWRRHMDRAVLKAGYSMAHLKPKRGSDPIQQFLKALSRVRADLQPVETIEVEIESFGSEQNPLIPFGPIYEAFQQVQLAANMHSFDDQIYLTIRDLLAVPEHRRRIQQQFEYILVDEFQDLNGAQLALVDILSRPHRNLFVVGDDDQLIYGWRFAKPANILEFHDRMPPKPLSATYTLVTNYRCSRAIVSTSQRLIDHNLIREPKDIQAAADAAEGSVQFVGSSEWGERAAAICAFLQNEKQRLPESESEWRKLAVLCRYKSQQPLVAMALDSAAIPRTPLLVYRLFTHSAARLLRSYLSLIIDPKSVSPDALSTLLNRPNRYIRRSDVSAIVASNDPWQTLVSGEWGYTRGAVPDLVERVTVLHDAVRREELTATMLVESIISEFELVRFWNDEADSAKQGDQDEAGPLQIVNTVRMLATDSPSIPAFLSKWDRRVESEAERFDMTDDTLDREEDEGRDQVVISTIHASKGREYQSVVIVDYEPDLSRMTSIQSEEERRVLYVGVTRAKESVLLTVDRSKPTVHPYVRELIEPPTVHETSQVKSEMDRLEAEERDRIVEVARSRQKLASLRSGDEERRCRDRLVELDREIERLDARVRELEQAMIAGGIRGLLSSLFGQRGRLERDRDHVREERARVGDESATLNTRLLLLAEEPEFVARESERNLRADENALADNRAAQARLASRLVELDLLA